jgi:uncharacterized membrane protein YeaQ/YmgE (transglycosylase-associated protein family)
MGFIAWIVVGLVAGWLAGQVMKSGGYGVIADIILGLLGGVLGGWIFGMLGIWPGDGPTAQTKSASRQVVAGIRVLKRDQPATIGEESIPPIYAGLGGKRRNSLSNAFSISFERSWCASLTVCFVVPIQTGRLATRSRISKAMLLSLRGHHQYRWFPRCCAPLWGFRRSRRMSDREPYLHLSPCRARHDKSPEHPPH